MKLDQINDLAGCRAIVDDMAGVRRLVEECEKVPHSQRPSYDYIERPKPDGYRSVHLVFDYVGKGEAEVFSGRRVELQVRTRLQHSWATAVEAVGLFMGQDMKGGEGDPDWLRLFALMSAEFSVAENCPVVMSDSRHSRVAEIKDLSKRLNAIATLEDLRNVARFFDEFVHDREAARFYLITYNHASRTVNVHPYQDALVSAANFDDAERKIEAGESATKVVLVEVEEIESLVEAYPNYFGDVTLFVENLRKLCAGKDAVEYTMAPQALAPRKPWEKPDLSWFTQPRRRRWSDSES